MGTLKLELINNQGLRGVVSGDRTIEFATITPEQMEYLFKRNSKYVRAAQAADPLSENPLSEKGIKTALRGK